MRSSALSWRAWWLTYRMQGLVLVILAVGSVLLVAASILLAQQTSATRAAFEGCLATVAPGSDACQGISAPLNELSMWQGLAKYGAQFSPLILGMFLGAPIVAREIEGRTAPMAWALDAGRARWFVQRTVPILVVVVLAGVLIGIGGDFLASASPFGEHPLGVGFSDYGSRLGQVPVRAAAVAVLGIPIGAVMGRQLPALLLTAAAALVIFALLNGGMTAWMNAESSEPIDYEQGYQSGAHLFGQAFRDDRTGALISTDEWDSQNYSDDPEALAPPGMHRVWLGIPGERYPLWVARESVIILGASVLVVIATIAVVGRRRPS